MFNTFAKIRILLKNVIFCRKPQKTYHFAPQNRRFEGMHPKNNVFFRHFHPPASELEKSSEPDLTEELFIIAIPSTFT
jgi:hypothetical protein